MSLFNQSLIYLLLTAASVYFTGPLHRFLVYADNVFTRITFPCSPTDGHCRPDSPEALRSARRPRRRPDRVMRGLAGPSWDQGTTKVTPP